jgi:serine/threonine protein kinase
MVVLYCAGFVGSPSYIAPEILHETAHYNESADVYSFGILVWFVSQHECLAYNRSLYSSAAEHKALLKPYQGKAGFKAARLEVYASTPGTYLQHFHR